ncbi:MAG: rod-binding protein [Nitrospiraceae bacterium]
MKVNLDGFQSHPWEIGSGFMPISRPIAGDESAARLSTNSVSPKEAAQQFEGYFISHLLTVMRQTIPTGPFESKAAQTWYSLYDAEIGKRAAESGGLGLARALEQMLYPPKSNMEPAGGPLKSGVAAADIHNGRPAPPGRADAHLHSLRQKRPR